MPKEKRQKRTKIRDLDSLTVDPLCEMSRDVNAQKAIDNPGTSLRKIAKRNREGLCQATTTRGKPCKMAAVYGDYCAKHKIYAKSIAKNTAGVYSKYAPSLRETYAELRHLNDSLAEEINLCRALLANVLVKYEHGKARESDLIYIIEQIRKLVDFQQKFAPENRPVDTEAINHIVVNLTSIIAQNIKDQNVVFNIVSELDNLLKDSSQLQAANVKVARSDFNDCE